MWLHFTQRYPNVMGSAAVNKDYAGLCEGAFSKVASKFYAFCARAHALPR